MSKQKYYIHELGKEVEWTEEEFNDWFWQGKVHSYIQYPQKHPIIDGHFYTIVADEPSYLFKGFGGRLFVLKFFDFRIQATTNLWHQGEIPKKYRHILKDNAVVDKHWFKDFDTLTPFASFHKV